eukprot:gnl/TRDRNA2_/TRDRNA2_56968_c0_seq1.p1 gnl/TRDRNA2_/TRDRNA2_56968_c0~~gnl/TRDRNA2_/TRDRNA2_56968_c0_seq1.p1  ORF type:complete len:168 (-),score=12.89 gnl/TRDRNA2_/TRDRNA2_56968_c0_seq1:184-636(-)
MMPEPNYLVLKDLGLICKEPCSISLLKSFSLPCECDLIRKMAAGRRLLAHTGEANYCTNDVSTIDACAPECEPNLCGIVKTCKGKSFDSLPDGMKKAMRAFGQESEWNQMVPGIESETAECVCVPGTPSSAMILNTSIGAVFAAFVALAV